jgi:RNA recognition motif-containing protein
MASSSATVNDPRAGLNGMYPVESGEYSNQAGSLDSCALIVELEGLPYDYAFNESDIFDLFSRYGQIKTVEFLDTTIAPDIALVEFKDRNEAESAVQHLHN